MVQNPQHCRQEANEMVNLISLLFCACNESPEAVCEEVSFNSALEAKQLVTDSLKSHFELCHLIAECHSESGIEGVRVGVPLKIGSQKVDWPGSSFYVPPAFLCPLSSSFLFSSSSLPQGSFP